jgi:hypothetical protein
MKRLNIRGDAFHPEWNPAPGLKMVALIVARLLSWISAVSARRRLASTHGIGRLCSAR